MSTAQALRNLARDIDDEVERDLRGEGVVSLKSTAVAQYKEPDPETEADRIGEIHRQMIAKRQQRIADTKKGLKAALATISSAKKDEKARYDALLADFAEREAAAKEQAARDISADERLVASSKAALEALIAE